MMVRWTEILGLSYRDFVERDEIANTIKSSKNFDEDTENVEKAKSLLVFDTSKQHTWLVRTEERLYCVLDDIRKEKPKIQWSMTLNKARNAEIKSRDYSANSGMFDISNKVDWLYTKKLFGEKGIVATLRKFIS